MWIAFKFVSLSYDKQLCLMLAIRIECCELLSNLYLCPMINNLHKFTSLTKALWIAFKFVSLSYDKQRHTSSGNRNIRCELLSNLYLCPMINNRAQKGSSQNKLWIAFKFVSLSYDKQPGPISFTIDYVVNCFQICIFVLW